jgi:hypothetical protein
MANNYVPYPYKTEPLLMNLDQWSLRYDWIEDRFGTIGTKWYSVSRSTGNATKSIQYYFEEYDDMIEFLLT